MKNTGIVRRVDELGRIVLPKELRRTMDIKEGDPMEIHVDEDSIVLKKYETEKCVFCGSTNKTILMEKNSKHICLNCLDELVEEDKK